jgi:hypothetical protein
MDCVSRPDRPAQRRGCRTPARETKPRLPYWQLGGGGTTLKCAKRTPEPAKMAACAGGWRTAAVAKQSQWASPGAWRSAKRTQGVGRELRKSLERTPGVSASHLNGANEATIAGLEGIAPIGGMTSSPGRKGTASIWRKKATTLGKEWIITIGGTAPTPGGNRSGPPGRETSGRPGGRDGGIRAYVPHQTGSPCSRREPADGSEGGLGVPSALAGPGRGRSLRRCWYRLGDPGREACQASRPDLCGPSSWKARGI